MSQLFLIAIGGTGMRCLEAFVHLCAMGMFDNKEINILGIDTDFNNGNLERTQNLIHNYIQVKRSGTNNTQKTYKDSFFSARLNFYYFSPEYAGERRNFRTISKINRLGEEASKQNETLAGLLFDQQTQDFNLHHGYRAQTHIGSHLMYHSILEEIRLINSGKPEGPEGLSKFLERLGSAGDAPKVFIVGSIFGGTGASSIPIIPKALRDGRKQIDSTAEMPINIMYGATLLTSYFRFSKPKGDQMQKENLIADSDRFGLNCQAALKFYNEDTAVRRTYKRMYHVGWPANAFDYDDKELRLRQSRKIGKVLTGGAMSKETPLLIQTKQEFSVASGKRGEWTVIEGIDDFIDNVFTNDIDTEAKDDEVKNIISGIPSPWARALIFKYALNFDPAHLSNPTGLMKYYESLQNEWKGLVACIALNNDKITVRKIELAPSRLPGDPDFEFYEVKGALGRMLFDDAPVWGNPLNAERHAPFLQAIMFNVLHNGQPEEILIGATSPFSIFFTLPKIKGTLPNVPFYDKESGRFQNPLRTTLKPNQVQLLYDYVNFIRSNIFKFGDLINTGRVQHENVSYDVISEFLLRFMHEIKEYAYRLSSNTGESYKINPDNIISTEPHFQSPFDVILNAESKVYIDEKGLFYLLNKPGSTLVTLNNLLLDTSNPLIEVGFSKDESPDRSSAYLLRAGDSFFALPFTTAGMRTFQGKLKEMVNAKTDEGSSLLADLQNLGTREIKVSLRLKVYKDMNGTDSIFVDTTKVYQTRQIKKERIIVWPDFISLNQLWTEHYLYSELPHNTLNEVKAFPLLLDGDRIKENGQGEFEYACAVGTGAAGEELDATIVVPQPAIANSSLSYEIYKSRLPIIGVELRIGASEATTGAGFLIGRREKGDLNAFQPNDHRGKETMTAVNVGIDFGSNNTCVSFQRPQANPELVHFKNRRRALLGSDHYDPNHKLDAKPFELLFFQKEEPKGKFRSLLQIHNDNRLSNPTTDVRQVAMGGFPVFERNVPILYLDPTNREFNYLVDLNGEPAGIKYNMKWAGVHQIKENGYKHAFIKSVWLMTNAELMSSGFYPTKLSWAYPFAMSDELHRHYDAMWKNIGPVLNLRKRDGEDEYRIELSHMTESEAVAQFAIDTRLGHLSPGNHELAIGFDVGGSTTDILMIVQRGKEDFLVRQSSLLMAAGPVTKSAQNSQKIRDALRELILDKANPINVWGVSLEHPDRMVAENALFFFNTVFDRLGDRRVEDLYQYFYEQGSKEIFTLVSFITGMLLFYSGQLASAIIQDPLDQDITTFKLGFFGKGGNIFNWIISVLNRDGPGEAYFKNCFVKGFELMRTKDASRIVMNGRTFDIFFNYKTNYEFDKTEVAYGLLVGHKIKVPNKKRENRLDIIGKCEYAWDGIAFLPTTVVKTNMKLNRLVNVSQVHIRTNYEKFKFNSIVESLSN